MTVQILDNILPKNTNLRIIDQLCHSRWNIACDSDKDRFKKIFSEKNSGFSYATFIDGKTPYDETILNLY